MGLVGRQVYVRTGPSWLFQGILLCQLVTMGMQVSVLERRG